MRDRGALWLRTACALFLAGLFCSGSAQYQYIKNGDMSILSSRTGLPAYWNRVTDPPPNPNLIAGVDSSDFHSPPYALRLQSISGAGTGTRTVIQPLSPIPKGRTIRVSFWVKDSTISHANFDVAVHVGKIEKYVYTDLLWFKVYSVNNPNNPWQLIERECYIDPSATIANIEAGIWNYGSGTGVAWVDDVEVTCPGCPVEVLARWSSGQRRGMNLQGGTASFGQPTSYTLSVLDPRGRIVASEAGFGDALTIDKSALAAGTYLVRVNSLLGDAAGKLVVER